MRILLDEDLPRRLGPLLTGHDAVTVQRAGWSGIKNGKLLSLASSEFDVFLTMDGGLEFQQNLSTLPVAVLIVEAVSNRIEHLELLVPEMLKELVIGGGATAPPASAGRSNVKPYKHDSAVGLHRMYRVRTLATC